MWARAAVLSLAVVAAGSGAFAAEALFKVEDGRAYIPPPPGTPTRTFDLDYNDTQPWRGGAATLKDLQARAFPEPVTLVSVDEARHSIRFVTTEQARSSFGSVPADLYSDEPKAPPLVCADVMASVRLSGPPLTDEDRPIAHTARICPFAETFDAQRQLIVEGLDRRGKRLFVALSPDPRWSISESLSSDGALKLEGIGRKAQDSTYVDFRAPIDARLKTLRIWQVDDKGKPFKLGDTPWDNVKVVP